MQVSMSEVTKMVRFIKNGGTLSLLRGEFCYFGVRGDLESHETIQKFNENRDKHYERLEQLFYALDNDN
jgi:hypothetical protein